MSRFKKWAEREYSAKQRVIALLFEGIFSATVIPFFLATAAYHLDMWFNFPRFTYGWINFIVAVPLIVTGLALATWSVWVQFTLGRGTPSPMMPTQRLIVEGPYAYCRNPMSLGVIVFYLGVVVWVGSVSAAGLTLTFSALLIMYDKLIEEKELEEKFASEYLEYKRKTPFLIPRLWRKKEVKH